MSEQDPELEAFSKFIVAIEPWLGEVVLVGGWAHRLYRLDPRARKLDYLPLTTLDGDVAVPPKLKKEESTVRKRLLEAGFVEEFMERTARRLPITTTEKGADSTRSFSHHSKGANTIGTGSGRQRRKWVASRPSCFATSRSCCSHLGKSS
jgi:hypothetical protein